MEEEFEKWALEKFKGITPHRKDLLLLAFIAGFNLRHSFSEERSNRAPSKLKTQERFNLFLADLKAKVRE